MTVSTRDAARRERNRRMAITTGILVLLALVIATGVCVTSGSSTTPDPSATRTPAAHRGDHSLVVGAADAPVKVVVYEDFLCPYCREFEAASRATLRDAAEKGTAVVEYRPFHLLQDDYSTEALTAWAAVLEKGTPEQALQFHDLLYENQPYESDSNKPSVDDLAALAKKAGVKESSILDAMKQSNQSFVDAADKSATDADVQGTPTVLYDGKPLVGSPSQLADTLKQRLGQ